MASVVKLGMVVLAVGGLGCGEEFSVEQEPEAADGCEPAETARVWWDGGARYRQQLVVRNAAPVALGSDATVILSLNTAALVKDNKLTSNCRDLHIVHESPQGSRVQLPRMLAFSKGAGCADSAETQVFFRLAEDLAAGSESSDYFLYYANPEADLVPAPTEGVFDVADAKALLVCSLDGTVECIVGPQPSDTRGLRFASRNACTDFSGVSGSRLKVDWKGEPLPEGTFELFFRLHEPLPASGTPMMGLAAASGATDAAGLFAFDFDSESGRLRLTLHDGKSLVTFQSARSSWNAGAWMHLALAWSEGSLRLYVDGVVDSSWSWSTPLFANPSQLFLGETSEGSLRGALDEVRISSVARYGKAFNSPTGAWEADGNTELLLHFDEDGADPRLPGVAIDSSPRRRHALASNVAYVPGPEGFGQPQARHGGLIVESETFNRVLNPSFEHGLKPDHGWDMEGTLTMEQEGAPALVRFGNYSARLRATGVARFTTSIAGESEGPAALSAYVRTRDGSAVTQNVVRLVWAGNLVDQAMGARYEYAGGGWWRLWYQAQRVVAPSVYGVELADGADVVLDGVQWERWEEEASWEHRGWPSTYADGSLGDAYAWDGNCDGTADGGPEHESCSVRLGVGSTGEYVVQFDNESGLIAVARGTVSLWFRPLWADDVDSELWRRSLLQAGQGSGHGPGFNFEVVSDRLQMSVFDDVPDRNVSIQATFSPGAWAHAVGSWNGNEGRVSANAKSASSAFAFEQVPERLHLGGGAGWTRAADAVLADFRLFDTYLTDLQVEQLHHAGLVGFGKRCEEALPK